MSTIYLFNGVIPTSIVQCVQLHFHVLHVSRCVAVCCFSVLYVVNSTKKKEDKKQERGIYDSSVLWNSYSESISLFKRWTEKWTISTPRKFWQTAQNHILIRKIYFLLFFKPNFSWCPQTKSKMNFIRMFSAKFMWNAFPASENSLCKEEILLHWIFQILWLGFFGIGRCLTIFDQFKKNMIIWILKRFFITHELLLKNYV